MDVARWGLGKNELPRSVVSVGGRFGYTDDGETANTQIAVFDYGNAELIFEVRGLRTKDYRGASDRQRLPLHRRLPGVHRITRPPSPTISRGPSCVAFSGGGDHFGNFVAAVRSGRRQDLKADIEEGHLSSALCHLANISYRLGRPTQFNGQNAVFGDDRDANETFARMREHLSDNSVPLDKTSYLMGRRLTIDAKTERFVERQRSQSSSDARISQGL